MAYDQELADAYRRIEKLEGDLQVSVSALGEASKRRSYHQERADKAIAQIAQMMKLAEEAIECAGTCDSTPIECLAEHAMPRLDKIVAIGKGE